MKTICHSFINLWVILFVLGIPSLARSQSELENELSKIIGSSDISTFRGIVFGRLPENDEVRWVHAELTGDPLKEIFRKLKQPGSRVQHMDGPFGSDYAVKLRFVNDKNQVLCILRIWNSRVALEKPGAKAVSFDCETTIVPEGIRLSISKFREKSTPGARIMEAAYLPDLLDQLALNDPQI